MRSYYPWIGFAVFIAATVGFLQAHDPRSPRFRLPSHPTKHRSNKPLVKGVRLGGPVAAGEFQRPRVDGHLLPVNFPEFGSQTTPPPPLPSIPNLHSAPPLQPSCPQYPNLHPASPYQPSCPQYPKLHIQEPVSPGKSGTKPDSGTPSGQGKGGDSGKTKKPGQGETPPGQGETPPGQGSDQTPTQGQQDTSPDQTGNQTGQDAANTPGANAFAQAPSAGTSSPSTFSPNMFGDQFAHGVSRSVARILQPGFLNGREIRVAFPNDSILSFGPPAISVQAPGGPAIFTIPGVSGTQTIVVPFAIYETIAAGVNKFETIDVSSPRAGSTAALFVAYLGEPGTAGFELLKKIELAANPNPNAKLKFVAAIDDEIEAKIVGDPPPPPDPDSEPQTIIYLIPLETEVAVPLAFQLANPSSGHVGREQLSESMNPLPRDRYIFNFDHFNNTPLAVNGWDVNRYTIGVEKTFLNNNASLEVRLPFAGTLSSDVNIGAEVSNLELGNLRTLLKLLLYGDRRFTITTGFAAHFPTGDDLHVFSLDGTELVTVNNESVILTPYFGGAFTPNDRWFFQGWVAADFDTRGNPVYINSFHDGMHRIGRLTEQTLLQIDGQVGYWLVRNEDPCAHLRGLAPFVELHYTSSLGGADKISNHGFVIGDDNSNRDELNLTVGTTVQLGDRLNISGAAVLPLRDGLDRSFDYQLGVRLNWFFGPTADSFVQYLP